MPLTGRIAGVGIIALLTLASLLPQAARPPVTNARRLSIPIRVSHLRRRAAKPENRRNARAAPPVEYQLVCPARAAGTAADMVAGVVEITRLAVTAPGAAMETGLVEPKLNVGACCAPAGADVTDALRFTFPVNPPTGVRVIVEVFAPP